MDYETLKTHVVRDAVFEEKTNSRKLQSNKQKTLRRRI